MTVVLFVTDWFPPASVGGVEAAAWALALAVAAGGGGADQGRRRRRPRVAVLTPALPGGPAGVRAVAVPGRAAAPRRAAAVVRIYYAPRGAGIVARVSGGGPAWAPPSPGGVLPLLRAVAAREGGGGRGGGGGGGGKPSPVILHAHSSASPFALACLAAGRALGMAAVLTEHSIAGSGGGGGSGGGAGRAAWAAAAAALAPPTVTAVSAAAAADAAARLGRRPGSVAVLANAVDGGALAPCCAVRKNWGDAPPAPGLVRVLAVTRLTVRKGAGDLGAAIRAAAAADPALAFTVVGGGPALPDLERGLGWREGGGRRRRCPDADPPPAPRGRVALAGPAPPRAIPPLLAAADAFLSASPTEAFGLAALEAGAAGCALVVRGVGGAAEALAPLTAAACGGGGGGRAAAVTLVPPSTGPAGLASGVVAAAAAIRAGRGGPPATSPPLAAILAAHCWHRAAATAVGVYERAAAAPARPPPPLPGRPVLAAARALLHAALCAWATVLDWLDPPGRVGTVTVA